MLLAQARTVGYLPWVDQQLLRRLPRPRRLLPSPGGRSTPRQPADRTGTTQSSRSPPGKSQQTSRRLTLRYGLYASIADLYS